MKLFACRVYEDGTLVRDYVPTRDPFGRVGLYDLESGVFSAPTIGALRADVVPPLPQGYTAVEYVESDGTQYLDTGYKVSNQARVICDCQFTRTDVAQRNGLNDGSTVFLWGIESAFSLHFGSIVDKDWNTREDTGIAGDTARHTFDLRPGAQWFDDKRYGTNAYNDNSSATMWLFGGHEGSKMNYACSERIYSCQIYEGNGLKRNYVPVQDASGKAGLYDCVANTFVPASAGTLASGSPLVLGGRPDTLFVTSCPDVNGIVAPAYGFHEGLAAGRGFVCSVPSVVTNVEKGVIATCVGYIVTVDGNTVAEGSGASFDYVHPACVAGAVLVWRWRVRHLLPQGTTAIEYVQFPGGVYVDTGVVMADHELRFTYEPTEYVDKASVIGQETGSKYVHWSVWNQKYYWGASNAESHAESPLWTQSRPRSSWIGLGITPSCWTDRRWPRGRRLSRMARACGLADAMRASCSRVGSIRCSSSNMRRASWLCRSCRRWTKTGSWGFLTKCPVGFCCRTPRPCPMSPRHLPGFETVRKKSTDMPPFPRRVPLR